MYFFLTSRASPFGLCFHSYFRHNGFLYKTTRISPRVTTQRCRHWQRGMAIANANANAAMRCTNLRGPAAILFISRDTCSDSIAKLFRACFYGVSHNYRAIRCKWGIARMCLCKIKYQGGGSHHFGGVLTSLKKYRAIWDIAAIVSQYRAIWGH